MTRKTKLLEKKEINFFFYDTLVYGTSVKIGPRRIQYSGVKPKKKTQRISSTIFDKKKIKEKILYKLLKLCSVNCESNNEYQ